MNNRKEFNILIVDDETEYQQAFSYILSSQGFQTITCSDGYAALELLKDNDIDLVMTDLKMPKMDGMELVHRVKELYPAIEIMVVTAFGTIESAVQSIKYGATGYFVKGSDPEGLILDINRMAKIKELEKDKRILLHQNTVSTDFFLESRSPVLQEVLHTCKKAADSGINVLLLGESGVGKEVFANYIHRMSERKNQHFIPVNCQVFGDGTIESELFGHEKGAFTGATDRRIGRFEEANYGTLFLDEIGDLPKNIQGKLLRVLESRTIERVGSNKPINLDIRLICATNKDLQDEIVYGNFREDLLYRINALTITIPPLRQRKEDLPELTAFFLEKISKEQKKKITEISNETKAFLTAYDYPGNVRELKNILERMVALSEDGVLKGVPYMDAPLSSDEKNIKEKMEETNAETSFDLREARGDFEKKHICHVLKLSEGNVTEAAKLLGITKRQLWNKLSEYDIQRDNFK